MPSKENGPQLPGEPTVPLATPIPPPGWFGADCGAGSPLAASDELVVMLDRIRAYPTGVEFWVCFYTAFDFPEPLIRALNRPLWFSAQSVGPGMLEPRESRNQATIWAVDDVLGMSHAGGGGNATAGEQGAERERPLIDPKLLATLPGPTLEVVFPGGFIARPRPVAGRHGRAVSDPGGERSPTEQPELYETARMILPSLAFAICYWLRPIPASGAALSVRVSWSQANLAAGSADIDLTLVRSVVHLAKELIRVNVPHHRDGGQRG